MEEFVTKITKIYKTRKGFVGLSSLMFKQTARYGTKYHNTS